jgi:RNA polymerase sigma factor (sigma-70 family)
MASAVTQTDAELLASFARQRDGASFEALVRRHGPMVLRVCQRLLHNPADADDAFQATFVVLARKARVIGRGQLLANWLYGVANRIALKARVSARRRQTHEQRAAERAASRPHATPEPTWTDLRPVLDEELSHLPDKYRAPLVLCYLEGKTNDEVAEQLGCSRGAVAGTLSRGRDLLRDRLARRGLMLSGAVLGTLLAQEGASAAAPTAQVVSLVAASKGLAGVSANASSLASAALKAMTWAKIKVAAVVATAMTAVTVVTVTLLPAKDPGVWQFAGGRQLHSTVKPCVVRGLAVSADGKLLVSSADDKTVKISDAVTGTVKSHLRGFP